ncbi:MAG: hypothetical protein WB422_14810 [Pseudolabrys sp.]
MIDMAQHLLSVDATARYANPSANLVRPGPLYFSGVYLGDDPDPNIRFQILRDITGRFGGDSN